MLTVKGNVNYAATVVRVPKAVKAENSDRLYKLTTLGITVIGSEEWIAREGELAILFPSEVRLSDDYLRENNLYSSPELNKDTGEKGYVEKNGRVRAIKLRGNISNGMMMPLTSLTYLGEIQFEEGVEFDTVGDVKVCEKYEIPVKEQNLTRAEQKHKRVLSRVGAEFLPEHYSTEHYLRNEKYLSEDDLLTVTQKLHGTSVRLANTVVRRELSWKDRVAKFFGVPVQETEYDLVAGSRKVIKDPNNPNQQHFYKQDVWSEALAIWGDQIPKNHIVYGELVGYLPGTETPIQAGHTYECKPGEMDLYVYRVATVTENGAMVDLSWEQVRAFCQQQSLNHVPELDAWYKWAFHPENLDERNFYKEYCTGGTYRDRPVPLSPGGTGKDEGVTIRVERDRLVPEFYKMKNLSHYEFETKQLDTGEADIESVG